MVDYKYISADNHMDLLWYPKGIIQDRIPSKFKEQAPKVVETESGTFWEWEGKLRGPSADGKDNAKHLKRFSDVVEVAEGSLPPSNPQILLNHMDVSGTYAGVFYGATRKWDFENPDLQKAVYRAFNDFAMEVSSVSPDRIIILPWLNVRFPETCAEEVYRLANMGAKAVELSPHDVAEPLFSPVWEPVWAAAEETGLPICSHIGDASGTPYPPNEYGQSLAHFSQVPINPMSKYIAQYVFSGMLERHPGLRVSIAECRIGWLPFLFSWMDRCHRDRLPDPTTPLPMKPSEYIKRQMTFTFEEDYVGAKMLQDPFYYIQDTAIWGADYPHEQGQTWPDPEPAMAKMFEGADPALKQAVVWDRSAKLFGIRGPGSS